MNTWSSLLQYPRAEVRYLPESAIADVPKVVAGLRAGRSYESVPVPSKPAIRRGRNGSFHDKGLEGASHHAIVPNVNRIDALKEVWPSLSPDEGKLFDAVARSYLASVMPDYRYWQTTATLDVSGFEFRATTKPSSRSSASSRRCSASPGSRCAASRRSRASGPWWLSHIIASACTN